MIGLDTNCQKLLLLLLQENQPLPANKLARKLQITPRMARYRLSKVEIWLHLNSLTLIKQPGVGYLIDARPETRRSLLLQLEKMGDDALVLPPHKRIYLIIITIFLSPLPVVVKQFQTALNISRTTVLKDLHTIDVWLIKYDLRLQRRQNYGCQIVGNESSIREAMIDCFIEGIGEENLIAIMGDKYAYRQRTDTDKLGIEHPFIEILQKLNIDYFTKILLKEEAGTLSLSDHNFVWLVLCLASLTNRALRGIYIQDGIQSDQSEWDEEIYQFAKELCSKINRQFGVRLPESETIQLACLMKNAAIRKSVTRLLSENQNEIRTPERLSEEYGADILSLAEEIVTYASVYLHPALRVDRELLTNLANHLSHLPHADVSRVKLRNPLLADIRREYAHIYFIAENCVDIIYRHFNFKISEDEIGYLTMYFAAAMERLCISERKKKVLVICNAGRATAMLLVSRIRVEFPSIDIVGVMSYLEWKNRVDSIEYDLIVSTIPIQVKNTPVVIASPLLASQDAANIRAFLKTPRTAAKAVDTTANHDQLCLKNLIKADTIKLNVLVRSWEEAVEQAGEPLLRNHLIEHRYIQAMKETIINFGPYMVIWQGTALLHARPEDGVRQLCMGFTTFRNPINFGNAQNDPVKMAFVLGAVDNCSHMPALYELSDLMRNHEVAHSLQNTVSHQRVLKLLSDHCKDPGNYIQGDFSGG